MKYKIFVCSSSGIEYISHSPLIRSIPLELKPSNIESYYENDLDFNLFYARAHLDKKMNLVVKKRTVEDIKNIILPYKNDETNIYILLSGFYNDDDCKELSSDKLFVFRYNLYGYTLAHMALMLEKSIKRKADYIYADLNYIKDNTFSLYLKPKNELEYFYDNDTKKEIISSLSNSLFSCIDQGNYNSKISNELYNNYLNRILSANKDNHFFIEYTNSNSLYLNYFLELLNNSFVDIPIDMIQISPSFSSLLNENAIGIGYIKKE